MWRTLVAASLKSFDASLFTVSVIRRFLHQAVVSHNILVEKLVSKFSMELFVKRGFRVYRLIL